MIATIERWLRLAMLRLSRGLTPEVRGWLTALAAESESIPEARNRLMWTLGAVRLLVRDVSRMRTVRQASVIAIVIGVPVLLVPLGAPVALTALALAAALLAGIAGGNAVRLAPGPKTIAWPPRVAVVTAAIAVIALAVRVCQIYPQVLRGAGTSLYIGLLATVLAAYTFVTWLLTSAGRSIAGPALIGGATAAALWTAALPAGAMYSTPGGWPTALYAIGLTVAFAAPAAIVAAVVTRQRDAMWGSLAGALTGGYAAVANLVGGLILVMALPNRVPADSDVLARYHTPSDILGATVGEDLAVFVALMIAWPIVGLLVGLAASAAVTDRRRPTAS